MTPFKFRLQKVLDLKVWREKEEAGRLGDARRQADEAQRTRELLELVRASGHERLAVAHGAGGTSAGYLQSLRTLLQQIDEQIAEAEDACVAADRQLRTRMSEFSEALRERRVLEQLRERQLETRRSEEAQADQKVMDDIAIARFARTLPKVAVEGGSQ